MQKLKKPGCRRSSLHGREHQHLFNYHARWPAQIGRGALYLLGGLNAPASLLVTRRSYTHFVVSARIATWTVERFQRVRLSFRRWLRRRQLISQCSGYRCLSLVVTVGVRMAR
jgi:hypothetical protein